MIPVEKPRAAKGMKCPDWKKDMSLVCHQCPLWIHVRGKHPQSEEHIDHWNCAKAWLPYLLIENSQMQRQTGAAVESARNEATSSTRDLAGAILSLATGRPFEAVTLTPPGDRPLLSKGLT